MPQSLSQRDSKWANIILGTSNKTIGSHGCTITCISMLAGLTPDDTNRRMNKAGAYANTNLVDWTKLQKAIPWIEFKWRGYGYGDSDNDKVRDAIIKNGGCLVEVDFDNKIATPNDRHWVLFIGNQKMIDPWTGEIKPTSFYPIKKGYAILDVKTQIKQEVPTEEKENMTELYTYLGVENDQQAKDKLREHLGEKDGKCEWGSADGNGGHLGSARREITSLKDQLETAKQIAPKELLAAVSQELGIAETPIDVTGLISAIKGLIEQAKKNNTPTSSTTTPLLTNFEGYEVDSIILKPKRTV